MRGRRDLILGALAWLLASLVPAVARAQDETPASPGALPMRQARVGRDPATHDLTVTVSFRDVIDEHARRKIQSGLPTVVVFRGYVFPEGAGDDPRAVTGAFQSCRITFDVWNEVYRIQVAHAGGEASRVALNMDGVLRRCAEVRELPIRGTLASGSSYFMGATVEVNPISQDMLEQIRRWVSRPPGSGAVTPGDSIFGSFVGLFVARIGKADRSLSFRTNGFVVPP